jgi:hypothetical protein
MANGGEVQGAGVGRGGLAKDEELDEAEDEEGDGELAEEEALRLYLVDGGSCGAVGWV